MRRWTWIAVLALALAASLLVSLTMGAVPIPVSTVLAALREPAGEPSATAHRIVWDLRLARSLLAVVIGAALAASGTAYQALFQNPLADPFVIGASGGAALGATIAIILGAASGVMLAAFAGALIAVAVVYGLGQAGGRRSSVQLLLAGATLGTLLSAAVSLLMFLNDRNLHEVFAWLMGGLSGRSWPHLRLAAPLGLIGIGVLWLCSRPLDALTCGEETAQSLGLSLSRARALIVAAATLSTAAAVASGGIIGFVGLLAPHMARRLGAHAHRVLVPSAALLGALLLLWADSLARTVMAPLELPVGILTALLGAPTFLWLLGRR
ncbi:MAG: iron ABC transporter permease [Anaerolineae bacterium]